MKEITLLRHAKSSWEHEILDDFDRPLNDRGLREANIIAQALARKIKRPEKIITSPAIRAYQTAQFCREAWEMGWSDFRIRAPIYEASESTLLHLAEKASEKADRLLFVGHNPGFSLLFDLLTGKGFELKTANAVVIRFAGGAVQPGKGKLIEHLTPKDPS